MTRRVARQLGVWVATLGFAAAASAEVAWVRDTVVLNLREGPSSDQKILGAVKTGDSVEVLERGQKWIRVRAGESEGWMPEGFLQSEEPAVVRLNRFDADVAGLRENLERTTREAGELREQNQSLTQRESALQADVTRLTREVEQLRAGARWPEWIAGASILGVGLILGVIAQWSSGRRGARRIRL